MGSIHSITLPAGYGHSLYGVPMGSIHSITLPAGYGHSLYGVPMGSIHSITLPAGYGHSLYGVPMGPIGLYNFERAIELSEPKVRRVRCKNLPYKEGFCHMEGFCRPHKTAIVALA